MPTGDTTISGHVTSPQSISKPIKVYVIFQKEMARQWVSQPLELPWSEFHNFIVFNLFLKFDLELSSIDIF